MHTCTWCGSASKVVHTRPHPDAPDQAPILLCLDRRGCWRRMSIQTEQQLTGARP